MAERTIAAISTPLGTGGVGMVRLSGGESRKIASEFFQPLGSRGLDDLRGYQGVLGKVADGGQTLDEAIAFVYRAPKSYTGEDVVELSCHGGMQVLQAVLRLCLRFGADLAGPGEFTKRAFLNGKLDLAQAEAVMDIIGAGGEAGLKAAASAREGALSRRVRKMAEILLSLSGHLAAWADYPEEEIQEVQSGEFLRQLEELLLEGEALLRTYDHGHILREGISCVLAGKPNVGKSTLMNLLAGETRSIVTEVPGTTRDIVEDSIRLGDVVLRLSDMAGIRNTENPVERIGVEMARRRIETAQLILAVFDGSGELDREDEALLALLQGKPVIAVVNKNDMPQRLNLEALARSVPHLVSLSARDGSGQKDLEKAVYSLLHLNRLDPSAAMVANERQRACLAGALDSLREARDALAFGVTWDAVGVCIDCALDFLLSLTGERATEKVVDEVFSRFCVGK